jgi:hypothetical protein
MLQNTQQSNKDAKTKKYTIQQQHAPAEAPVPCVQDQLPLALRQEGFPGVHHLGLPPGAEQHCTTLLQRGQEGVLGHLAKE